MEEYEPEDESLQEAIANSLSETGFGTLKDEHPTTQEIVKGLNLQINQDQIVRFNIIRRNVWDGATRAMTRANFSSDKAADVKFTDDHL
ncbi:hypothetical protein ANANG_G00193470 [Anguilla anguilla]|uniref:Uncharacterized protein n=1 Tax=Anguilla anguilla TaxID=7936 RepID=A0A9D3M1I2_ANGAN|nr:hypothetical protein ANANG_G00193470 [Anguilla anguilla]